MSNPSFDTGDDSDRTDAIIRGTERYAATSGDHAGELPPEEYCARVATRVTVTPRSWRIDDTGTSIDFTERMGLNHEVWACERPGVTVGVGAHAVA